jgi:hypothetical protein
MKQGISLGRRMLYGPRDNQIVQEDVKSDFIGLAGSHAVKFIIALTTSVEGFTVKEMI